MENFRLFILTQVRATFSRTFRSFFIMAARIREKQLAAADGKWNKNFICCATFHLIHFLIIFIIGHILRLLFCLQKCPSF